MKLACWCDRYFLYLVFSFNAPGFISLNNQMNVLRDAATIGIAAWAMTLDYYLRRD